MPSSGSMGSRSEGASPDNRKRGGGSLPFFMAAGHHEMAAAHRPTISSTATWEQQHTNPPSAAQRPTISSTATKRPKTHIKTKAICINIY